MKTQHQRPLILGAKPVAHDVRPQPAGCPELGDLLKEIDMAVKEECDARGEIVDFQAAVEAGLDVGHAIGEREGDFLGGGAARFAHVIAADADGVPVRHFFGAERDDVRSQAKRGARRKDVSPAGDVFLENIVLHRAGDFRPRHALFLGDHEIEREQDGRGRVDGHRGADLVERDFGEDLLHVCE